MVAVRNSNARLDDLEETIFMREKKVVSHPDIVVRCSHSTDYLCRAKEAVGSQDDPSHREPRRVSPLFERYARCIG